MLLVPVAYPFDQPLVQTAPDIFCLPFIESTAIIYPAPEHRVYTFSQFLYRPVPDSHLPYFYHHVVLRTLAHGGTKQHHATALGKAHLQAEGVP
jgi:hypothetical protein